MQTPLAMGWSANKPRPALARLTARRNPPGVNFGVFMISGLMGMRSRAGLGESFLLCPGTGLISGRYSNPDRRPFARDRWIAPHAASRRSSLPAAEGCDLTVANAQAHGIVGGAPSSE